MAHTTPLLRCIMQYLLRGVRGFACELYVWVWPCSTAMCLHINMSVFCFHCFRFFKLNALGICDSASTWMAVIWLLPFCTWSALLISGWASNRILYDICGFLLHSLCAHALKQFNCMSVNHESQAHHNYICIIIIVFVSFMAYNINFEASRISGGRHLLRFCFAIMHSSHTHLFYSIQCPFQMDTIATYDDSNE